MSIGQVDRVDRVNWVYRVRCWLRVEKVKSSGWWVVGGGLKQLKKQRVAKYYLFFGLSTHDLPPTTHSLCVFPFTTYDPPPTVKINFPINQGDFKNDLCFNRLVTDKLISSWSS